MVSIFEYLSDVTRSPKVIPIPMCVEHAQEGARIHATAFAHPWRADDIELMLADRTICGDAVTFSGRRGLVGFVLSRAIADEAEILTLAVDPTARRRGAASSLLARHLVRLRERETQRLFLEVDATNQPALALYIGLNFRQVGIRESYYRHSDGKTAKALILRLDLA